MTERMTPQQRTLAYIAWLESKLAAISAALGVGRQSAVMMVNVEGADPLIFNVHDPHWRVCLHAFRYDLERTLAEERARLARMEELGLDHLG